jgi:hypothetical protein
MSGGAGSALIIGPGGISSYTQSGGLTLIGAGGTLSAGAITENGGWIQVDGTIDPAVMEVFATLSGTGTVVADLTNDGTVILGDNVNSPGRAECDRQLPSRRRRHVGGGFRLLHL